MLVELTKRLRELLCEPSIDKEAAYFDFFELLDSSILEISCSDDDSQQRHDFEEEIQVVFDEGVEHSNLSHVELFLNVLLHARPILASRTLISTWFDLLLRPALREPRLSAGALDTSKKLVLEAMEGTEQEIVSSFHRRLLDLFLLDVLNESSGKDIIEWAQLDKDQRDRNSQWKSNLKDILTKFGCHRPELLLNVMNECFTQPRNRLQLLTLLDAVVAHSAFLDVSTLLLSHPFMDSILRSLEVDNSATVCTVELTLLVKVLPSMVIKAFKPLRDLTPRLFAILGRALCWRTPSQHSVEATVPYSDLLDLDDKALLDEVQKKEFEDDAKALQENWQAKLKIREKLNWKRLERSFDLSTSSLPAPRHFFSLLYFLFPCNIVKFLRSPVAFLEEKGVESPWTVGWDQSLDESRIRSAASSLFRTFVMHPSILTHDVVGELADEKRWETYDVPQILGECATLNAPGISVTVPEVESSILPPPTARMKRAWSYAADTPSSQTPKARTMQLETPRAFQRNLSLQDLVATAAGLKSNSDTFLPEKPGVGASHLYTPPPSQGPSRASSVDSTILSATPSSPTNAAVWDELGVPARISETIAGLQREVLMLRTELSFELLLKKENVRLIARLHDDSVKSKSAELQQQRQQNRLREYRSQLLELQKELRRHQEQAQKIKNDQAQWNEELTSKLSELREQKKTWLAEANTLRTANIDLKAHLNAQSRQLDEAQKRVTELDTTIKEDAHKVQRLRDYEKRIEQLTEMHRMWNDDISMYNQQSKEMDVLMSEYQKMKMRVETYEKAQEDVEASARASRHHIQVLEAELVSANHKSGPCKQDIMRMLSSQASERSMLAKSNAALRDENEELRNKLDELRADLEIYQAQAMGTQGLVQSQSVIAIGS